MTPDQDFMLGLTLGLVLGILIDRTVIPLGERIGDLLAIVRLRRRPRGR